MTVFAFKGLRRTFAAVGRPYLVGGWIMILTGWVVILVGWIGVQSTTNVPLQLAYLASGAVSGIALITMGASVQGHDDVRVVREALVELLERMDDIELVLADLQATRPADSLKAGPARRPARVIKARGEGAGGP